MHSLSEEPWPEGAGRGERRSPHGDYWEGKLHHNINTVCEAEKATAASLNALGNGDYVV